MITYSNIRQIYSFYLIDHCDLNLHAYEMPLTNILILFYQNSHANYFIQQQVDMERQEDAKPVEMSRVEHERILQQQLKEQEDWMEKKFREFLEKERDFQRRSTSFYQAAGPSTALPGASPSHNEEVGPDFINDSEYESESDNENSDIESDMDNINGPSEDESDQLEWNLSKSDNSLNFSDDNSTTMEDILNREYEVSVPTMTLPPVSEKLARNLMKWLREAPSRDKTKEFFAQCLIPENVEGLLPVKINEIVYQKLPFKAKVNDQRLRGINTYFARGLGPLISALDTLIKFEASLASCDPKSIKVEKENLILGKTELKY